MEWILWWQLYNFSNNAGTNEGLSNAFSAGQGLLDEPIVVALIAITILALASKIVIKKIFERIESEDK